MGFFEPKFRLIPSIEAELEWKYLVNETLCGERAIVPLLQEILQAGTPSVILTEALKRQFDEEVEHVRLYFRQVGSDRIGGSGYDGPFKALVRGLPSVTLKLFALQAMLEGTALGALDYRLSTWLASPSAETDTRAKTDETNHVQCGHEAFSELIRAEGPVANYDFKEVSRAVNGLFVQTFNGEAIARVVQESFGKEVDPNSIETSAGMSYFRRQSSMTLAKVKRGFLSAYAGAVTDASIA